MENHDADKRKRWIEEALSALNPRELMIVRKRRLTEDAVTLENLGKDLGISKERVRQIEHAALKKLKTALIDISGDPRDSGILPGV